MQLGMEMQVNEISREKISRLHVQLCMIEHE